MNVLWMTTAYPWSGEPYRGIFYQTQAEALARQNLAVCVMVGCPWVPRLAAALSPRHGVYRNAPAHQSEAGVEVHRVRYLGHRFHHWMGRPHLTLARKFLADLPFLPDIVHGHAAYPMGLAAVKAARTLGVPSVITLHGSDVNVFGSRSRLGRSRLKAAVLGADRVLCVSGALQDRTEALTGRRPECMPIGINLRRFAPGAGKAAARIALGLPVDRPIVLYVGNLLPAKGVPQALEALAHPDLAGALGVFLGAGALAPALEGRPNCLGRKGVPNGEVARYLEAADCLILPSFSEGLPTILVEAGASGTPVVATPVGGIPELLAGDRGLLVEAGSSQALREAILAVLAHPQEAAARAGRLRDHILETYDSDRNAARLTALYASLVSPAGDRSPSLEASWPESLI